MTLDVFFPFCLITVHLLATVLFATGVLFCVMMYQRFVAYTGFQALLVQHGYKRPRKYQHCDQIWGNGLYRERKEATLRRQFIKLYEKQFEMSGKISEEKFFPYQGHQHNGAR